MRLVIVAADDEDLARTVSSAARQRGIPVNAVDRRALCSFILPSILDRSPLVAALSTSGAAPILARILRAPPRDHHSRGFRSPRPVHRRHPARRSQAQSTIRPVGAGSSKTSWDGPIGEHVLAGREQEARAALDTVLADAVAQRGNTAGEVYLVGAGPGDPDLLTFRALRLMQKADVVVYDRLVSREVLDLTRRDAERIYAGKQPGDHAVPQDEINELLARLALAGNRVLRLKGGDPFIFGRGGRGKSNRSHRSGCRSRSSPESPRPRDARPTREFHSRIAPMPSRASS